MKITTRTAADLTYTVYHIENDGTNTNSREVQEPILCHDRAYEVLAILLSPVQPAPRGRSLPQGIAAVVPSRITRYVLSG